MIYGLVYVTVCRFCHGKLGIRRKGTHTKEQLQRTSQSDDSYIFNTPCVSVVVQGFIPLRCIFMKWCARQKNKRAQRIVWKGRKHTQNRYHKMPHLQGNSPLAPLTCPLRAASAGLLSSPQANPDLGLSRAARLLPRNAAVTWWSPPRIGLPSTLRLLLLLFIIFKKDFSSLQN